MFYIFQECQVCGPSDFSGEVLLIRSCLVTVLRQLVHITEGSGYQSNCHGCPNTFPVCMCMIGLSCLHSGRCVCLCTLNTTCHTLRFAVHVLFSKLRVVSDDELLHMIYRSYMWTIFKFTINVLYCVF